MKLSDLIFESQILLEDKFEIRKTPNGRTWGVYNTTVTPNVLISSHKTKNQANIKADQLRNPTPPKPKSDSGSKSSRGDRNKSKIKTPSKVSSPSAKLMPGVHQVGANKWTVFLPDGKSTVDLENGKDAEKLDRYMKSLVDKGTSADQITKQLKSNPGGFLTEADLDNPEKVGKVKNSAIKRKITKMSVDRFMKEIDARRAIAGFQNTGIGKWVSGVGKGLIQFASLKIVGVAGNTLALFFGTANALSQIEVEMIQAQGNPQKLKELEEEARIVQGQAVILFSAFVIALLKDIKSLKKLTNGFRTAIKAAITGLGIAAGAVGGAVGGSVAGPGGTVAGGAGGAAVGGRAGRILGILAGEASTYVFFFILAIPAVQRFVAQLLQDWWLGDAFGFIGGGLDNLLELADNAVDGRFGTGFLADKLTIDAIKNEGPTGEYYSESEWAKKLFGVLLFPPGDESKFVPYMPETKREDLMSNLLMPQNVENDTTNSVDAAIDKKIDSDNAAAQQTDQTPVA